MTRLHRLIPTLVLTAATSLCPAAPPAGEIVCEGVIGNSGESGEALVRFAPRAARGMGVAFDRFDTLWDRAGTGRLNRYAADGRMLGHVALPARAGRNDALALAGDTLVLLVSGRLYSVNVADPRAEARPLKIEAERMSLSARDGLVACIGKDAALFLLEPGKGSRRDVCSLAALDRVDAVELGPEGTVYVRSGRTVRRIRDGRLDAEWQAGSPGERMQLLDGYWFGHGWHGTIRRFGLDLQPDPGVVLGGASGHFIGHLPQNSELLNGRGMARLADGLYAVSGIEGVMHLVAWDRGKGKLEVVRRIGALPAVGGMALDGRGRLWALAGSWQWADGPTSPMRFGVNAPEAPGIGQAVVLDSGAMVAPAYCWGQPTFYFGTLDAEVRAYRLGEKCNLRRGFTGSAVYRRDGKLRLLVVDNEGRAQAFGIGTNGQFRENAGDVTLQTAEKAPGPWTSLAMKDEQTLLAAAGSRILEFAPDGDGWKETRRRDAFDGAGKLRGPVRIAAHAGRLWLADEGAHRVLCIDLATGRLLAAFGRAGAAGTDLTHLSSPTTIAAHATRAVVHDAGNQRLLKLRIRQRQ